jgi:hypothetical protein
VRRIRSWSSRQHSEAIASMVAGWATDVAAWHEPLLLAWRRADVDDLNQAARAAWDRLGRLSGPELEAPGGRRYRFGDRVLLLSPGPGGAWVTSEQATIVAVDLAERSLTAYTPDGRVLELDTQAIGADRLTHAYALTVHRAQGVTADTAHVLDNGGGRELAYVAMSRARSTTRVYVPAGSLDDAVEQLRWSWTDERRQRWAHDQGQPQPDVHRLVREFDRLTKFADRQAFASTAGAGFERVQRRRAIEAEIAELQSGSGRHAHTPAGQAARALAAAERALNQARQDAADALGPFNRRRARKLIDGRQADRNRAQHRWNQHVAPELDRLRAQHQQLATPARSHFEERDAWLAEHPAIHQQLKDLARQIGEHDHHDIGRDLDKSPGRAIDLGL